MQFLPLFIVLELILSTVLISIPSIKKNLLVPHTGVLGTSQQLAQADTTTPSDITVPDNSTPTDQNSTPLPTDQTSPTDQNSTPLPTDQTSPTDQAIISPSPAESASPSETIAPTGESPSPREEEGLSSPTPPAQEESPSPSSTESAESPLPKVLPSSLVQVLDEQNAVNNTNNIDAGVAQLVQTQAQQATQALTPEAQVQTAVTGGNQDVQIVNDSLVKSNFTNISLVTQDLSQQLDRSTQALNNASTQQTPALKQDVTNLCLATDASLRSAEEAVPEDLEQDIEINRAKCLNITSQP